MTTPDPTRIHITLFGDGGCGKSSITLRLVRSQWTSEYDPTIEDSYTLTRRIDGQTYHLSLTDTAGQEEYRGMWGGANLKSADAFLLVYDITNRRSLEGLQYFHDVVGMEEDERFDTWTASNHTSKEKGSKNKLATSQATMETRGFVKPIKIVAGNKCDLAEMREVPAREGLDWARKRECGFMETSARNTVNIEETFELIVRRVVEARRVAGLARKVLEDGENVGDEVDGNQVEGMSMGIGTRRAVTRPLSPLRGGDVEKGGGGGGGSEDQKRKRRTRWREWWRRWFCMVVTCGRRK